MRRRVLTAPGGYRDRLWPQPAGYRPADPRRCRVDVLVLIAVILLLLATVLVVVQRRRRAGGVIVVDADRDV